MLDLPRISLQEQPFLRLYSTTNANDLAAWNLHEFIFRQQKKPKQVYQAEQQSNLKN